MLRCLFALILATAALAQSGLPDRRIVTIQDMDFYGGDIRSIFETDLQSCTDACLADQQCRAFTYNGNADACFLKSGFEQMQPYEGAVSGRMVDTTPPSGRWPTGAWAT